MADRPVQSEAVLRLNVLIDGAPLDDTVGIVSVETRAAVNICPRARVVLSAGAAFCDRALKKGQMLEIAAGNDAGAMMPIHTGRIGRIALRAGPGREMEVEVASADVLLDAMLSPGTVIHHGMTDAEVIAAIVADAGGIIGRNDAGRDAATKVRFGTTPWDFLLARAAAGDCDVVIDNRTVDVAAARPDAGAALLIEYGTSVIGFDAALDPAAAAAGRVRGSVTIAGTAIRCGAWVTLAGFDGGPDGPAYVSGVRHSIKDADWQTELTLGREPSVAAPAAATPGLIQGEVKAFETGPDGEIGAIISVPCDDGGGELWARLGQFYASNGAGAAFYPEIGDTVALGFLDGDAARPVVLASLYGRNGPPVAADNGNGRKSIVTRSGLRIEFDDAGRRLSLSTPGGRNVILDDEAGALTVTDGYGHIISMSGKAIDIVSAGDLAIRATGELRLESGKLHIAATGDCEIAALNVKAAAQIALALSGQASASLKASGQVEVTGAMVMIN